MGCMFFSNFSCQPYVINIQLRNTDNICTDLYILLKPQSELGYLGYNRKISYSFTIATFYRNYPGISQFLRFLKDGLLKISMPLLTNTSGNGLKCQYQKHLVLSV